MISTTTTDTLILAAHRELSEATIAEDALAALYAKATDRRVAAEGRVRQLARAGAR